MIDAAVLGMLLYPALSDIKRRSFNIIPVIVPSVIIALFRILSSGNYTGVSFLEGLIPGILAFVLSYAAGEAIGRGDCLVIMCTGAVCGLEKTLLVVFLAFSAAALTGLVLMSLKNINRKYRLPFVPFIWAAFTVVSIWLRV